MESRRDNVCIPSKGTPRLLAFPTYRPLTLFLLPPMRHFAYGVRRPVNSGINFRHIQEQLLFPAWRIQGAEWLGRVAQDVGCDGSFIRDLLTGVTGIWKVVVDGGWCVAASNRLDGTYLDIWDFGVDPGNPEWISEREYFRRTWRGREHGVRPPQILTMGLSRLSFRHPAFILKLVSPHTSPPCWCRHALRMSRYRIPQLVYAPSFRQLQPITRDRISTYLLVCFHLTLEFLHVNRRSDVRRGCQLVGPPSTPIEGTQVGPAKFPSVYGGIRVSSEKGYTTRSCMTPMYYYTDPA